MLLYTNLGEYKVNASQIHGKLVKCQEQITYFCAENTSTHMHENKYHILYAIQVPNVIGQSH